MNVHLSTSGSLFARHALLFALRIARGSIVAPGYLLQAAASIFGIVGVLMLAGAWREGLDDVILTAIIRIFGVRDGRYAWDADDVVAFGAIITLVFGIIVAVVRSVRARTIVLPTRPRLRTTARFVCVNTVISYTLFTVGGNIAMQEPLGYTVPIIIAVSTIIISLGAFGADAFLGFLQQHVATPSSTHHPRDSETGTAKQ
ncbi:MAG: hypothetical protein Q7T01_03705 [bacterium]|nr:hypothetical protein [bacterium]